MSFYTFSKAHPFYQEFNHRYEQYLLGLNLVIDAISQAVPNARQHTLQSLLSKLQIINSSSADRNQYIQYACELTVAGYLCRVLEANAYDYEYPGNEGKNVDSFIEVNGVRFNIEVKCPNPKQDAERHLDGSLSLRTHGRISDFVELKQNINLLAQIGHFDSFITIPNSDYNVKEALVDAAKKFPRSVTDNQLNCVVLCADGSDSLQHYYHCLFGAQGLFTDGSFHNPSDYAEVDAVIFTNLRHRHDRYLSSSKLSNPWLFEEAFNLIVCNTSRAARYTNNLGALMGLIPNYNQPFIDYTVPGDAPSDVLDGIKLAYYISSEVSQVDANCFD
jgi:hypothetical protein